MAFFRYFSHWDGQGYKPYMRYTLLGGRGADYENVAYYSAVFHSTSSIENAIQTLEHLMVYNDSSCCGNGHRYNILDPLHNRVSIGVAYSSTYVYFDEEFENLYMNLNFSMTGPTAPDPYYVTMTGAPTQSVTPPTSIYVAFDSTPASETRLQLDSGPHEYGPGTLEGGILPKGPLLGGCARFTSGTTVCADTWKFTSATVDIAFSLKVVFGRPQTIVAKLVHGLGDVPCRPKRLRKICIRVPAVVGRSVLDLVDLDVCHPVQNAFEGDPALHPGERSTRTRVHPACERHVLADILSIQLELVRVVEPARITVGRTG